MSLINRMLQDLEQRSTGDLTGMGLNRQVRAVPERGGLHAAWWLVAALAILSGGLGAWLWLRPPAAAPVAFSLRLATDLSALPSPVATAALRIDQSEPVLPAKNADRPSPAIVRAAPDDTARAVQEPIQSTLAMDASPAPETQRSNTAGSNESSTGDADDSGASPRLAKQVKELTAQQRAENAYRAAGSAFQQGRSNDAIASLEQAMRLDSQHIAARQMLVGLLLQAKRNDEAVRLAREGLALDPSQVGLAMILARVQVEQGELRPALETLDHSLPYALDRADYQAFMAALLQRDKRFKESIDHYAAALGKAPQNGVWWMGLGISLQAENRLTEAREAFSRAKTSSTLTPELQAFVDQKLSQLTH